MTDESLIEKAAKAIHQNYSETAWSEVSYTDRVWAEGTARKVLRMFEEAHTPTNDEREAPTQEICDRCGWAISGHVQSQYGLDCPPSPRPGFRRPVPPEPSGEATRRGTFGHVWPCPLFYVGNWRPLENGHAPVRPCSNAAVCGSPEPQGAEDELDRERWHHGIEPDDEMHARGATSFDCDRCGQDPEDCYCGDEPQGEPSDAQISAFWDEYRKSEHRNHREATRAAAAAASVTEQGENR